MRKAQAITNMAPWALRETPNSEHRSSTCTLHTVVHDATRPLVISIPRRFYFPIDALLTSFPQKRPCRISGEPHRHLCTAGRPDPTQLRILGGQSHYLPDGTCPPECLEVWDRRDRPLGCAAEKLSFGVSNLPKDSKPTQSLRFGALNYSGDKC